MFQVLALISGFITCISYVAGYSSSIGQKRSPFTNRSMASVLRLLTLKIKSVNKVRLYCTDYLEKVVPQLITELKK